MRKKNAKEVCNAFQDIFKEGRIPYNLRSDKGREFCNNEKKLFKCEGINYFTSQNEDKKCAIVESYTYYKNYTFQIFHGKFHIQVNRYSAKSCKQL